MAKRGIPTDFESFLTWEALIAILSYDPATGPEYEREHFGEFSNSLTKAGA